jgi:hypothetical protein
MPAPPNRYRLSVPGRASVGNHRRVVPTQLGPGLLTLNHGTMWTVAGTGREMTGRASHQAAPIGPTDPRSLPSAHPKEEALWHGDGTPALEHNPAGTEGQATHPASAAVSMWSPPPESNRRPHPYHGTTRNRCADRHFPSSRPTVGVEVIGSLPAKVCAHFRPRAGRHRSGTGGSAVHNLLDATAGQLEHRCHRQVAPAITRLKSWLRSWPGRRTTLP